MTETIDIEAPRRIRRDNTIEVPEGVNLVPMTPVVINEQQLAALKRFVFESGMTSDIWGAELADGASDFLSTECRFRVLSKYPNKQLERILIINNGNPLSSEKVGSPFLSIPVTRNEYGPHSIGCKGVGTKLTIFRVGCIDYLYSYDEYGRLYKATFTPCSDEDGKTPIDFSEGFHKNKFIDECNSLAINYEFFENNNHPDECNLQLGGKGLEYCIKWFVDSDIQFDEEKVKSWLSTRYGQKKNFKIYFENYEKPDDPKISLLNKTHLGLLDDNGNPVTQYTDFRNKYHKTFPVNGVEHELWWDCRISSKGDSYEEYRKLKEATKGWYGVKFLKSYIRKESPMILHLNHQDIVTNITNLKESSKDGNTWLIFAIKPKQSVNEFYASNKSDGYSNEKFGKELEDAIKKIIKDESIKNNYHDKNQKQEDSEVVQFRDYLCNKENNAYLTWNTLLPNGSDKETKQKMKTSFHKKSAWRIPQSDKQTTGREVDLKAPEEWRIWFEFQNLKDDSDTKHLDSIHTRLNMLGRENSPFDTFVWVAKNHKHKDSLKQLLMGLDWGDGHCKKVLFLTKEEVFQPFDMDEVDYIDIDELISKKELK